MDGMGYEWHTTLQFIKPDLVDKVVKSLNFKTHRDSLHNSCGDTGIPVHLCRTKLFHIGYVLHTSSLGIPVRLYFWTCKVVAVADSWFIHWPMLVIYRCTYDYICIDMYMSIYIYIRCFFCVQPNSRNGTGKRNLGWMFREKWVKAYNDFNQICHQLGFNHDQRWAGQKLCRSSSKDWRPKSYHWTLATTIQGVAHLEMLGRTCFKGICRI